MIETSIKWRGKKEWFVHKNDYNELSEKKDEAEREVIDLKNTKAALINEVQNLVEENYKFKQDIENAISSLQPNSTTKIIIEILNKNE